MNSTSDTDQSNAEVEELCLLLENRTFVDYFNTFLCLPVFGQHVLYNYLDMEFEFEPPLRNRRYLYLDRREILKWLCTERLRPFKMSALYTEYRLCMLLRDTDIDLPGVTLTEGQSTVIFARNVIGTVTGMLLFRESMRGTNGELIYRCYKDIEAWRLIEDPVRKLYWKHVINTHYISQKSPSKINGKLLNGMLNLDLVSEEGIQKLNLDFTSENAPRCFVNSDKGLLLLQTTLLETLRKYWLPRHLLHFVTTLSKDTLDILLKPMPGDEDYLNQERRLRCRFMFPTIYQDSSIVSPSTSVFWSKSVGELPESSPTSPFDDKSDVMLDDDDIEHTDLFSLWGGPAKDIKIEPRRPSISPSLQANDSPDELGNRKLSSARAGTLTYSRSPVPIVLTSYLGGKKRAVLGRFPKTSNRMVWSLASDTLACCPFRQYLEKNDHLFDLQYLSFWTDVRNYLDTDEHIVDGYGQPLRRLLAHKIANTYLLSDGDGCEIFSETLKMSLLTAITTGNDVSLICMAQDIIQESLWESLKYYIKDERQNFLNQVRGLRYKLDRKQRRTIDVTVRASKSKSTSSIVEADPLYFFSCATIGGNSFSPASSPVISTATPSHSGMSHPVTAFNVCISEEQMWKAMELAVLCSEYGASMMVPQHIPRPEHLVDTLHSDYGSLHVTRQPSVRNEWLRSLLEKPKINIETIKVSRKVFLEKVDLSSMKSKDVEKEPEPVTKGKPRMSRRHGFITEKPTKPKSLMEVLSNHVQCDFFKRFMTMNKMNTPVFFWKAVEDLKELSNSKTRQTRVTQIVRKFFGKYAKYGATLDCHEEVIRQIPNMEKVTPGILICAQAAVFRTLERKWFPQYMETFPPESGESSPNNISLSAQTGIIQNFEDIADFVQMTKKRKQKSHRLSKTILVWKTLTRSLVDFCKAISSKSESQLFEMFLKFEVEREKASPQKDQITANKSSYIQGQHIEKSMMMSNLATNVQTRVVIRNRLVIMNRLPEDLRFWIEVKKFQDLVDSASHKGSLSAMDTEFLCDKARSIIACYLSSDIAPRVQVNIPNDMATTIINSLASSGPTRGLFHDAIVLIFPILYHYFRKFSDDWMKGNIPDEYFDSIEILMTDRVATTPHNEEPVPDFREIRPEQFKRSTQISLDENTMKIHFSLANGISLIYPQSRMHAQKSTTVQGRRMTKHSLHALHEETSLKKESVVGHGDKKNVKRHPKSGDRPSKDWDSNMKERQMSEKIVVKESDEVVSTLPEAPQRKRQSSDKARRLSILVETLNKEKKEKIKEQNRKFSKLMSFDEVVTAAMAEISETNSTILEQETSIF